MRNIVAFYPYTRDEVSYIHTMQKLIEEKYPVIDYLQLKAGWYGLSKIRTIYLNWIEGILDKDDKELILRARLFHIRIVWVFHNRIPHDSSDAEKAKENIAFLIKNSTCIILHSKMSAEILKEYTVRSHASKVHYVSHPNYIGDYCCYKGLKDMPDFGKSFVFGFLGMVRPYKNIEILIDAFQSIRREFDCSLMIAGKALTQEYARALTEYIGRQDHVFFINKHIDDFEMESYIDLVDVLVVPYAMRSSMNSGTMLMAYSYGKTTITPAICMAEDFPDDLIYKYYYASIEEHIKQLAIQMRNALLNGKEENARRGKELQKIAAEDYSKGRVREKLYSLI